MDIAKAVVSENVSSAIIEVYLGCPVVDWSVVCVKTGSKCITSECHSRMHRFTGA